MPQFLIDRLKREYPGNDNAVYGTLNKIGAMHGNKETAKGREMEAKHNSRPIRAQGGVVADPEVDEYGNPIMGTPLPRLQRPIPPADIPPPRPIAEAPQIADAGPMPRPIAPAPPPPGPMPPAPPMGSSSADEGPGPSEPPSPTPGIAPRPVVNTVPPRTPIGQDPMQQRYRQAQEQMWNKAHEKIPKWRTALGAALTISPRTAGIGQAIMHPPDKLEEAMPTIQAGAKYAEQEQQAQSGEELKRAQIAESSASHAAHADTLVTNAQTRKLNAETAAQRVAEIRSNRNRAFVVDRLKGREGDASYQPEAAPRHGGEWIPDPEKPGFGWDAPPAYSAMPAELAPFIPGAKPGDMIPHSELLKARAASVASDLESTKAGNKNILDAPTRTALASFGGDPKKPEDITRARKLIQQESIAASAAKRKPTEATVMVPDGKGGMTMQVIHPGQTVPEGAVTASGMSSANVPTAATRSMAERAPRVIDFANRIETLLNENESKLGPLKSRWGEFTAGKIGIPNKGYTQLRTNFGLLQTALMNMHVGARGSEKIMEHFHDLINLAHQDPDNLRAALDEIKVYAQRVEGEGRLGGRTGAGTAGGSTSPDIPKAGGMLNGKRIVKVERIH